MNRREVIFLTLLAMAIASVWVWRVGSTERSADMAAAKAEASAAYYPDDAVAYAWLTLDPPGDQHSDMVSLLGRFSGLVEIRDMLDVGDEMPGAAFEDIFGEIGAWIGTEVSVAVFDLGEGRPGLAAAVEVGDQDAAGEFLASWIEHREEKTSKPFERFTVDQGEIWLGDGNGWMEEQVYALADDLMVFATDWGLLRNVLDHVDGEQGSTLATSAKFQEARSAAPDRRFASVYVDYGRMTELMGGRPDIGVCSGDRFAAPGWLMASAGWVDRGMVVELVTPDVTSWWTDTSAHATAEVVPADSLGFVSIGFDPDIDSWREVLDECDIAALLPDGELFGRSLADDVSTLDEGATLADTLDLVLGVVEGGVGLDLEEDLFDHLGGQLVVAVHGWDREDSFTEGVAALSYRPLSGHELTETLDDVAAGIPSFMGTVLEQVDVGAANPATVIEGGRPFSFGYVLHDGFLTLGTSVEALEATVEVQGGKRDRLADTDEYRRTVGHISYDPHLLAYVDIERTIDSIEPSGIGVDADLYEVLSEGLSAIAIGVGTDRDYSRATLVLSLFPQ